LIVQAIGTVARAKGLSALAKKTGLTCEALRRTLSKDGNPSFGAVFRVFYAVGFRLVLP